MEWRKLNRALHRDLGYFCVGLTLLYAFTGVLLNHIHDWNPMYAITGRSVEVGALTGPNDGELAREALSRLKLDREVLSTYRPEANKLDIFLDGGDRITVDVLTGTTRVETVQRRTLTGRLNDLHLNRPGSYWTYIADFYAVALGALAVSGALLASRKGSVSKRGVALTLSGLGLALLSLFLAS